MHIVEILPLLTAAIDLFAAFLFINLYLINTDDRANLSFAIFCLAICCFSICVFLNYRATNLKDLSFWLTMSDFSAGLSGVAALFFIFGYIGRKSRVIPWITTIYVLTVAMGMLITDQLETSHNPVKIHVHWLNYTYTILNKSFPSVFFINLMYVFFLVAGLYGVIMFFRHARPSSSTTVGILLALILLYLAVLNDLLVEGGIYSFPFISHFGVMLLVLGMMHGLTRRFARLNVEAQRKNAITGIGLLATEVVHDLTAPLNNIKMAISIVRDKGKEPKEQATYLTLIENETNRLVGLTENILQNVREQRIHPRKVNLREYLDEVVLLLKPGFDEQCVQLECQVDDSGSFILDPDNFKRVIFNIANNALEGFKSGINKPDAGERRISTFSISVTRNKKGINFTFEDNGPGIPKQLQPRLFLPFTSHGVKFGTGLGLAVSKEIVEHHRGKIGLIAKKGKGTVFSIDLPD